MMDLEHLKRVCSSIGGQRSIIAGLPDQARQELGAAAAVTFGIIPVGEAAGGLVFGAVPDIHPDCREALATALRRAVTLIPFDDLVIREAITQQYLKPRDGAHGLDLPTFESPDFLRRPEVSRRLLTEKEGTLPERKIVVPPGRLALVDLRVHSVLKSLDRARRVEFAQTPSALPHKTEGEGAILYRERMPPPQVRAIVAQSLFYDGDEHLHMLKGQDLASLPHVLHPSELQLAELEGDEARFWVYDRLESVRATSSRRARPLSSWMCQYYFLHFGARFMRTLRLDVLSFALVKRSRLRLASRSDRLAPSDLERIFGLDFPKIGAADRT